VLPVLALLAVTVAEVAMESSTWNYGDPGTPEMGGKGSGCGVPRVSLELAGGLRPHCSLTWSAWSLKLHQNPKPPATRTSFLETVISSAAGPRDCDKQWRVAVLGWLRCDWQLLQCPLWRLALIGCSP